MPNFDPDHICSLDWRISRTEWDEILPATEADDWGAEAAPPWANGRIVYTACEGSLMLYRYVEAFGAVGVTGGIAWTIEPASWLGDGNWEVFLWDGDAADYVEQDIPTEVFDRLSGWWVAPSAVMPAPVLEEGIAA